MSNSNNERRFAQDVAAALIEIFFFDPEARGRFDRENQEKLACDGMTLAVEEGRIGFSLSVREQRGRQRSGVAEFFVRTPLSDDDVEHAREWVETFVAELNDDLMSTEPPPGEAMNVLRWV